MANTTFRRCDVYNALNLYPQILAAWREHGLTVTRRSRFTIPEIVGLAVARACSDVRTPVAVALKAAEAASSVALATTPGRLAVWRAGPLWRTTAVTDLANIDAGVAVVFDVSRIRASVLRKLGANDAAP